MTLAETISAARTPAIVDLDTSKASTCVRIIRL